jgi:geranylgeranyl reductase family protein
MVCVVAWIAMLSHADVIVTGAGPAGSTAAKLLASRGYSVFLLDRAVFPRHKTCASWINRLAFERFPYLWGSIEDLVESAFFGVSFFDPQLAREGRLTESRPSGYLSLRSKFDDVLRRIAMRAGAEFMGGCQVVDVAKEKGSVRVQLRGGSELRAKVLIGADGASGRVAVAAGFRKGWSAADYVLCANADIPYDEDRICGRYGHRPLLRVYPAFGALRGYGWLFPKRHHICVGIGGLLPEARPIRTIYHRFVRELQQGGHLPPDLPEARVYFDLDPVGAVHRLPTLVKGRVLLVGDAAGFVSGSTGEGIYPGMVSAAVAANVIDRAMKSPSVESALCEFDRAWRAELADYVKRLPGGEREGETRSRIDMIYRHPFAARIAGRIFLYGEKFSFRTVAAALAAGC